MSHVSVQHFGRLTPEKFRCVPRCPKGGEGDTELRFGTSRIVLCLYCCSRNEAFCMSTEGHLGFCMKVKIGFYGTVSTCTWF